MSRRQDRRLQRSSSWTACGVAGLLLGLGAAGLLRPAGSATAAETDLPPTEFTQLDLGKVQGAEACGECHVMEFETWQGTPHATGFKELHREPQAEQIAERMGLHLIKRNSLCLRCHYTPTRVGQDLRARSGVSCESCHGEGADWIELHNDYGQGRDWSDETPEHRLSRIEESRAAGMRRPEDLYGLAASCFECHFVPHEELVNVGGHSTGAATFDLWQRSQGVNRHNFLAAQRGGSRENAERGIERHRLMTTVGAALAVEYALRGVARAELDDGVYLKAMQRRLRTVIADLAEVQRRLQLDELDGMLRAASAVEPVPSKAEAILAAAEVVRDRTLGLLAEHDGSAWQSLDAFLEGSPENDLPELPDYRPARRRREAEVTDLERSGESTKLPSPTTSSSGTTTQADFDPTVLPNGEPVIFEAVGEIRRRIRPDDGHATLGGACSACHAPQNQWWFGDAHYATADRLFDADPRAREIAANYGVSERDLARGDQVCTNCHATVVSGRETREVQDGVGCESCHGAAADYIEVHQEGDAELGTARPGYRAALAKGMVELQELDQRMNRCSACHYINDERLISSGHPSGRNFDFVGAMTKIRHWESAVEPAAELRRAATAALAGRGPVPDVPIVTPLSARPRPPQQNSSTQSSDPAPTATTSAAVASRSRRPERSARQTPPAATARPFQEDPQQPLPEVREDGSLDELLRSVAERIEALEKRVAPAQTTSSEDPP